MAFVPLEDHLHGKVYNWHEGLQLAMGRKTSHCPTSLEKADNYQ